MRAAEEKERTRILAAPKKRAAVDKSDSYVMRRIEALSWSAEALLVGPMGKQRLFVPLPEFAYVAPSPPSLMPLLRPGEATAQELLALPVPALLERWLVFQLRQAKFYTLAEQVETSGAADTATLAALISRIDSKGASWREGGPDAVTPPAYDDKTAFAIPSEEGGEEVRSSCSAVCGGPSLNSCGMRRLFLLCALRLHSGAVLRATTRCTFV